MSESFPRQKARTRGFTLGEPRSFEVGSDGSRVVFLRSPGGDDPQTGLWVFDVEHGRERLVVEPADLAVEATEDLPPEERARRERVRETGGGIVSYAIDEHARIAVLVHAGRLFVADLLEGGTRELDVPSPVFDARPDPSGRRVAFVHGRALHVVGLDDGAVTRLAGEDEETVSWGMAEFVAAEEMDRDRGYWWAPDGGALLVARVDEAPVAQLWISDVADPAAAPRPVRYPAAGTANASVDAYVLALDGAAPVRVSWDQHAFPYLAAGHWDEHGPLIAVQSRDQRRLAVLAVDPRTGETASLSEQTDDAWVELIRGLPRRLADGRLVTVGGVEDAVALLVDGSAVTPPELEVRAVQSVGGDEVLFTASSTPTETQAWRWHGTDGLSVLTTAPGIHAATGAGGVKWSARAAWTTTGSAGSSAATCSNPRRSDRR